MKSLILKISVVLLIATVLLPASVVIRIPVADAAINKQINYQGKLTNLSNVAVADGTYNMEFILYDALTAGNTLWTETRTTTNKVQVTNGLFSVMLGSVTSLASVNFNQTVYLGVNIGGTGVPGWDGEMTPRKIIGAVPAAIVANGVEGDSAIRNTFSSATALTVAKAGTDYALQVDTAAASAVTGLKVTSAAATGGVALAAISSGTNENLTLDAKGSGTLSLGATSTGDVLLGGGSGSTGCTVTNSSGAFACTAGGSFTTMALTGAVTGATSYNGLVVTANTGVITTGTWNGSLISGTYGGTGVNNGANTITLGGNLVTSGAFATTLTSTAATNVTLPTSGTLYGTATGSITSAQLLGSLSNETGTGLAVFATSPTLTTPNIGAATGTSLALSGAITGATGYNGLVVTANTGVITTGTWQGTVVGAQYGGTGAATLTSNGVLYGNGTSAVQATAQGGANTILVANGGAPSFSAAITVGTSVTSPTINATTGFQVGGAAASGNYLRGNGSSFVASTIQAGDVPTLNQDTTGKAKYLGYTDDRALAPGDYSHTGMTFGFGSYNNDGAGGGGYADWMLFNSYTDASGGSDNALFINRSGGIGMRLYQQTYNSLSNFSTYKDIVLADNSPTAGYLTKYTSGGSTVSVANSLVYDNGTNIGIGNTAPNAKLHVGSVVETGATIGAALFAGAYNALATPGNDGTVAIFTTDTQAADKGGSITFGGQYDSGVTTKFAGIIGAKENSTAGNYSGYLAFYSRLHGASTAEAMRISSAGNVGIGLTNPLNKLDIATVTRSGTHATGAPLYVTGDIGQSSSGIEFRHTNGTQGLGFGYNTIYAAGSNTDQSLFLLPKGTGDVITYTTLGVAYTPTSGSATLMVNGGAAIGSSTYLDATVPTNGLIVSGNVGMGVTAPNTNLTVYDASESATLTNFTQSLTDAGINFATDLSQPSYTGGLFWSTQDNNATKPKSGIWTQNTTSGSYMYLGTSNSYATGITNQALTIDPSGLVGIGDTTPAALFTVGNGDLFQINTTGYVTAPRYYATGNTSTYITNNGTSGLGIEAGYLYANGAGISLYVQNTANFRGVIANDTTAYLQINGGTSGYTYFNGSVGIGVASPSSKLTLSDNVATGFLDNYSEYQMVMYTGGGVATGAYGLGVKANTMVFNSGGGGYSFDKGGVSTSMLIDTNGNVGIGTTGPDRRLDVLDASNPQLRLTYTDGTVYSDFQSDSAGDLYLRTTGDDYFLLNNSLAAGAKFAIGNSGNNEAAFDLQVYRSGAYTSRLNVNNFGQLFMGYSGTQNGVDNVGIGTNSSVDAKLEVGGNFSSNAWGLNGIQIQAASGTYTDSNTAASGTATNAVFNSFAQPTLAATNTTVTTTNAATLYVAGAPTAGTNQTITNAYALWVDSGSARIDDNLVIGTNIGTGTYITPGQVSFNSSTQYLNNTDLVLFYGGLRYNGAGNGVILDSVGLLQMRTAGNIHMTLNNTGLFGFGTTGPGKKVEINSATGDNLRLTYNDADGSAVNYADLLTTSSGDLTITPSGSDAMLNGRFMQSGSASVAGYMNTNSGQLASTTALNPGILFFGPLAGGASNYYGADLGYNSTASKFRTRIFSPSSADIVFASHTATTEPTAQTSFTERLVIDGASGNVGIGTSTPTSAKLVVNTTAGSEGLDLSTADAYANMRVIRNSLNATDKDMYIGYQSGATSTLHLYSNNAETLTVKGGNVGIGDTTPSALFTVGSGDLFQINSSGYALGQNGAAANPTFSFVNSTNTGMYLDPSILGSPDILTFSVAGTARLKVQSDNVVEMPESDSYLKILTGALCVSDNGTCPSPTNGTIYAKDTTIQSVDVAENYPSKDSTLQPGEVVMIDILNGEYVKRSQTDARELAIGVVSTAPGVTLGGFGQDQYGSDKQYPIALVGRVPVKVTTENGRIEPGDFLTSSNTVPGAAMKAISAGTVIGQALEGYAGTTNGSIIAFIKSTNYNGVRIESTLAGLEFSYTEDTTVVQESSETILESLLEKLSNVDNSALSQVVTDLLVANVEVITPQITTSTVHTDTITSAINGGGITIESKVALKGGLTVDSIGSIGDLVTFQNNVEFIGIPYLNSDTAGFAVVLPGAQTVDIVFTNEYLVQPIVAANLNFDQVAGATDPETQKAQAIASAQSFMQDDIKYVVTNKSSKGFTIVLNKPVTTEMKFSWTAFAVKNATTFTSREVEQAEPSNAIITEEVTPAVETLNTNNSPITEEVAVNPEIVQTPTETFPESTEVTNPVSTP